MFACINVGILCAILHTHVYNICEWRQGVDVACIPCSLYTSSIQKVGLSKSLAYLTLLRVLTFAINLLIWKPVRD